MTTQYPLLTDELFDELLCSIGLLSLTFFADATIADVTNTLPFLCYMPKAGVESNRRHTDFQSDMQAASCVSIRAYNAVFGQK